jgi:response regulator RpfG family c-di-GMP phosphodiesterase
MVDDNDIDIAVNRKLLQLADITTDIRSFNQCSKFFDFLETETAKETHITQIVLMDIMNGFECLQKFSTFSEERRKGFVIFMLSSSIDRNDIRRAEENPLVRRVLEKPLDIYVLRKLLEQEGLPAE